MSKYKILFQLSGSIACYKACTLISRYVQEGHEVQTAVSPNALQFIGEATLEGLTGKPVFKDTYQTGKMMDHIYLAQNVDFAVLCPASANSINQLAAGIATDVIGSLFLAFDLKKPYFIAPAMNQKMIQHPSTVHSLEVLKMWGVQILATGDGHQACGDTGPGRLLEPEQIYDRIQSGLSSLK
jgi:phosphopantothenoylcysteine synthetase/decarboxylase